MVTVLEDFDAELIRYYDEFDNCANDTGLHDQLLTVLDLDAKSKAFRLWPHAAKITSSAAAVLCDNGAIGQLFHDQINCLEDYLDHNALEHREQVKRIINKDILLIL